ncbi:hypothetical protein D3C80_1893280 [compost metagenome]
MLSYQLLEKFATCRQKSIVQVIPCLEAREMDILTGLVMSGKKARHVLQGKHLNGMFSYQKMEGQN